MKKPLAPGTLVIAKAESGNEKIGKAATTYAEQRSCPDSCVFFDGGGCYAEDGPVGKFVTQPLNRAAQQVHATARDIALAEARAIDGLVVKPGYPMRLHTVGDCKTDEAAQIVAAASARYVERGGGPVWTYTHAWREVERASWGAVNVLASCETIQDVGAAAERGYATSMVVKEFADRKVYSMIHKGRSVGPSFLASRQIVKLLPCPAITTPGVSCASCRLCMDAPRLKREGLTIGFAIHGTALLRRRATMALDDPTNPDRKLSSRVLIPRVEKELREKLGREPNNREIADVLKMDPSSVSEMRKSIRTGQPARAWGKSRRTVKRA